MNTGATWVLIRPGLTWHVINQNEHDPRGFYSRPTLCGQTTPVVLIDVLAYTQAVPPDSVICPRCSVCEAAGREYKRRDPA